MYTMPKKEAEKKGDRLQKRKRYEKGGKNWVTERTRLRRKI